MSFLEFLTSETPDKVSPRASSSLRVVSFNMSVNESTDLPQSIVRQAAERIAGRFHIIVLQVSLWL